MGYAMSICKRAVNQRTALVRNTGPTEIALIKARYLYGSVHTDTIRTIDINTYPILG